MVLNSKTANNFTEKINYVWFFFFFWGGGVRGAQCHLLWAQLQLILLQLWWQLLANIKKGRIWHFQALTDLSVFSQSQTTRGTMSWRRAHRLVIIRPPAARVGVIAVGRGWGVGVSVTVTTVTVDINQNGHSRKLWLLIINVNVKFVSFHQQGGRFCSCHLVWPRPLTVGWCEKNTFVGGIMAWASLKKVCSEQKDSMYISQWGEARTVFSLCWSLVVGTEYRSDVVAFAICDLWKCHVWNEKTNDTPLLVPLTATYELCKVLHIQYMCV